MRDEELIARIAEARRPKDAQPEPTRQQVEVENSFVEDMAASWNTVATLDPLVDKALRLVADRAREVEVVADEVTRTRELGKQGRVDPQEAAESALAQLTREEAASRVALENARKLVDTGRERLLNELIPEPRPNGTTTREVKEDIALIVSVAGDRVRDGFLDVFRRAVRRDDKNALGLLMGEWGEVLWRSRGGAEEDWAQLRQAFIAELAAAAEKRSPGSKEARTWALIRDGGGAYRYITGQGDRIQRRLKDIPR